MVRIIVLVSFQNLLLFQYRVLKKAVLLPPENADVAELVDAPDLGSGAARRGGSSPFIRTVKTKKAAKKWQPFYLH
jgi:hypothetical protein